MTSQMLRVLKQITDSRMPPSAGSSKTVQIWADRQLAVEYQNFPLYFFRHRYMLVQFCFVFILLELQRVTGRFYVWEISVELNWNRKYSFPEYFTFNGACLKVSRLARGLMHFKSLWPSLDLSQPAISGLSAPHEKHIRDWMRKLLDGSFPLSG